MFRFLTGFFIGFLSMFFYLNRSFGNKDIKKTEEKSPFINENPYRIINIMKEYQKMREKV